MNTRIFSVVLTATLVTVSSGCGMGNFFFGRGARCGACSSSATVMPPTQPVPVQPYVAAPYTQTPCQAPCQQPAYQCPPPPQPQRSGCFLRNWFGGRRNSTPPPCQSPCGCQTCDPCYSCYGSSVAGDCGCGTTSIVNDPYMVSPGTVIDGGTIIDGGTVIQGDGFQARRFDSDGARIIWEGPATPTE